MMDVDMVMIATFAGSWLAFGLVSGWMANRWSVDFCATDGWLTRIRAWEHDGRAYDRVGVRRWKRHLPEAGDFFEGGISKRHLADTRPEALTRFAAETRRAERVHWANVAFGWTFAIWTSTAVSIAMIIFGAVVHIPFIVIQRYNRARALRVLRRRGMTTWSDAGTRRRPSLRRRRAVGRSIAA